jgi:hypothetical protein
MRKKFSEHRFVDSSSAPASGSILLVNMNMYACSLRRMDEPTAGRSSLKDLSVWQQGRLFQDSATQRLVANNLAAYLTSTWSPRIDEAES